MTFANMSVAAAATIILATSLTLSAPVQASEICEPVPDVSADKLFRLSIHVLEYEELAIHLLTGRSGYPNHDWSGYDRSELELALDFMRGNIEAFIEEELGSPDLRGLGRFIEDRLHGQDIDRFRDTPPKVYSNLRKELACLGVEVSHQGRQATKMGLWHFMFPAKALYQAGAYHRGHLEKANKIYQDHAAKRCGTARIDISEALLAKGVLTEYRQIFASLVGDIPDEERAARLKRLEAVRAVAERLDWSSAHARVGIDDLSHENVQSDYRHGRDVAGAWVRHMGPLNPDFSPLACARSGAQREGSQGIRNWLALEYGQFKLHLFLADVERRLT